MWAKATEYVQAGSEVYHCDTHLKYHMIKIGLFILPWGKTFPFLSTYASVCCSLEALLSGHHQL